MYEQVEEVELHETARERYLSYALSVITARALPDVRDGLKPVQRRILYAMFQGLKLTPDAKPRKSAAVVGEVMAKYHPHGDVAIYDAMVRLAQAFALRYPLVEGQGNFGSLDGDPAAAMRYTEVRLRHLAVELLAELGKRTVDLRPNYDGTLFEPVVLPAQIPNLLVNGASGIAVGMATNIPPHHLGEVMDALVALIDRPELTLEDIVGPIVRGPDFPTAPSILTSLEDLREVYRTGHGAVEMRGDHRVDGRHVVITSLPYGVNKASLVSAIAEHIQAQRVPQLVDVRDESTEAVRIVLELKRGADPEEAMAFLHKRTELQTRFSVNMTVLCPVAGSEVGQPRRVGLLEVLREFLAFRREVTARRLAYDLEQLERRIHLLEGFIAIFDALDEAIVLIRQSDGRAEAQRALMGRFGLDDEQSDAVLETRLYRLARMEMAALRKELAEKRAEAGSIQAVLASEARLWRLVRSEISEIRDAYADKRRSAVLGPVAAAAFSAEAYIVDEDAIAMVTREGRIKRQKSYTDLSAVRVREGDELGWVVPSSTRESLILFTDRGKAYTLRVADVPATTGYGEPVQARFDFADGERVVGVLGTDPRSLPWVAPEVLAALEEGAPRPPLAVAVSRGGKAVRFSLDPYREPSTVAGRLFMRLESALTIDGVVAVHASDGTETAVLASQQGRVLLFPVEEINVLSGPGKGVMGIKLESQDYVLGFALAGDSEGGLTVETNRGRVERVGPGRYQISSRAGRGRELIRHGHLKAVHSQPNEIRWPEPEPEPEPEAAGAEVAATAEAEAEPRPTHGDPRHNGQGRLFDDE